jgi:pimeloyl-ACP methyl ester carboxylesterase
MPEQLCRVSPDIELCYETFGDPTDPTMLLVMGLATQMIGWPDDFCRDLADRGFHVVRFDNRDIGRSTHVDARPPTLWQLVRRSKRAASYALEDMAEDAAGLLRELDLAPAHVVGASMGGMIAQALAVRHPEMVLSLTSLMSTTGNRRVGQPAWRLIPMLAARPAKSREETVERAEKVFGMIGSKGFEQDMEHIRDAARRSFDRGRGDAAGQARQLAAVIASGDRTRSLRRIAVPTLVIHGTDDPLIRPSGGRATVRAIPNAELLEIEGMGHDLPRAAWPRMLDAIEANVRRAAEPVSAAGAVARP